MVSLKFPAWEISHCVEPLDWLDWLAKVSELMFFLLSLIEVRDDVLRCLEGLLLKFENLG